jgi:hypothetical protein
MKKHLNYYVWTNRVPNTEIILQYIQKYDSDIIKIFALAKVDNNN